ncbi:hypothetical protein [Sulfurospirillum arsenophilum]|uniref:hypothetical protein n=1 Tax=Sulfurospirillum arsenophilum TaxID=56698 RepID=UPI0006940172|nr:hypothetical protein [Sulfurospirillum arsenophilum]
MQVKSICGIDTLYYFAQSNEAYENAFFDLQSQLEAQTKLHESDAYTYANSAMIVKLGTTALRYLAKDKGVYWFRDINEYFKLGFKNPNIASYQHNIQIQLQGVGIYTIGLKNLLTFINDELLKEITTGLFEISRADLNCFVQYDFGFVTKEMFVSKKKGYHIISEFGNSKRTQTIYVGKKPFFLRLYDKKIELDKSDKAEIMQDYFTYHGFDLKEPIFNLEFEMHRVHFKNMGIRTLEGLLSNANNLFKTAMDDIRLIDLTTISKKDMLNNSKNRAKTLEIWEYIKENYSITEFLQYEIDLKRIPQKRYVYDLPKFITDTHELIHKALNNNIVLSPDLITKISDRAIDLYGEIKENPSNSSPRIATKYDVVIRDKEDDLIARYKCTKDDELIPYQLPFKLLGTKELQHTIKRLSKQLTTATHDEAKTLTQQLKIANNELSKRLEVM